MAVAGDPRILELTAPEGDRVAQFATHVGMVGCSLRHHGEEMLGLGGGLDAYTTDGKVFGIPLLYPWANRLGAWSYAVAGRHVELDRDSPLLHGDDHCLPIHGALAATSDWTVRDAGASWLLAELDFAAHPDLLAVFPFAHRLELGARTYDDLFALPGPSRFSVAAAGRRATVEMTSGFPYAQVYAPADQPVICFEPMTAPVDALRSHDGLRMVPAGETARTTFTLTIEEVSLAQMRAASSQPWRLSLSGPTTGSVIRSG